MRYHCCALNIAYTALVFASLYAAPSHAEDSVEYTGTATSLKTQEFLYGEKHVLGYRDGKLAERAVLYTCRDGSPFARKTVNYVNPLAPDFTFEDASNGMREGVRSEGGKRVVFFRGRYADMEKMGDLPKIPELVVDAGFDEFVRENWSDLLSGKAMRMNFLVPSRVTDMGFKVQHERSDTADGTPVEVFRLNLAGILGLILPGIDVYYSAADHVLIKYVGLSDLRDSSGDNNYKVTIEFHPGDRKPGDIRFLEDARQARLAPCK